AGTYTTTGFIPQLTLKIGTGWRLESNPSSTAVELGRADAPDSSLNFYVVNQVIDPTMAPGQPAAVASDAHPVDPPSAASLLATHPRLAVTTPSQPVGATHPGTAVSFSVKDGYLYDSGSSNNDCAKTPCVLLFRQSATRHIVAAYAGDANQFSVFSVNGVLLVATIQGPPPQLSGFLAEAQAVVNSAL
ncbi:MAG: hypothetical protein JO176_03510, partial [Acidimicrobiia bacterium]|nr:hypothetical protein [Acidimicrobiia bacterium]